MRSFVRFSIVVVAASIFANASSQEVTEQKFELTPIPSSNGTETQIIGGQKAERETWPATFLFKINQARPCTATVIGPQVMITAAHCLGSTKTGKLGSYDIYCETHWGWEGGNKYDLALCLSNEVINLNFIGQDGNLITPGYERVSADIPIPHERRLSILGFGCTVLGGSTENDLHVGTANLSEPVLTGEISFTVTGDVICSGDSGGSAYIYENDISRRIVGIAASSTYDGKSNFTVLSNPEIREFIHWWSSKQPEKYPEVVRKIEICGIQKIYSCRS